MDVGGRMGTVEACMTVAERFRYLEGRMTREELDRVLERVDALDRARGKLLSVAHPEGTR